MYESPAELIRAIVPNPLVSFNVVARVAGILYLVGIALPMLTERIAFSAYTSWQNEDPIPLYAPFDFEIILISTLGIAAGPADTAEETNVAVGLLDFIFVPFFTLTFPIVGAILTFGIIILGLAFLLGHKRYSNHLTWAFTILGSFYIMLFNMNAATLHARFGLYAVTIATALMLVVAIDRTHGIGLVSNNRYPLPGTYSLDQPQPKAVISDLTVAKLLRKVFSELSISLPDWIDNRLPDEKSELKKARLRKPYAGVMTRKEAEKHRD